MSVDPKKAFDIVQILCNVSADCGWWVEDVTNGFKMMRVQILLQRSNMCSPIPGVIQRIPQKISVNVDFPAWHLVGGHGDFLEKRVDSGRLWWLLNGAGASCDDAGGNVVDGSGSGGGGHHSVVGCSGVVVDGVCGSGNSGNGAGGSGSSRVSNRGK